MGRTSLNWRGRITEPDGLKPELRTGNRNGLKPELRTKKLKMVPKLRTPLESGMMLMGCGPSGGGEAFVGALDALVSQGATFLYAASSYRLVTSYTGPLARLQGNGTGSPEADIGYLANGQMDLAAAAAIAAQDGGTAAFGVTWYGQLGGRNATQTLAANRMPFSTAMNARGGCHTHT